MKIVFLEPLGIPQQQLEQMARDTVEGRAEVVCYDNRVEDVPTLIERSKDADVVVLSNFAYRKEVIEHCPNLKLIVVAFTGVDHVDIAYCKERGITVCNCAGYSTVAVADLVFGMLISLYRNIIPCNEVVRKGGTKNGLIGCELEGKKFGIVGTGAIGTRVGRIAQAFGCEVYAWSRTVKPETGFHYVSLEGLLSTCDIVSLHVPQTAETIGLMDTEKLALMKPEAVLINTARGPIVDSKALAEALKNGKLAGAAVDVFEVEPPVPQDHPLWDAPNLIATPHVAFASKEAMQKRAVIVMDNLDQWLKGTPVNVIC